MTRRGLTFAIVSLDTVGFVLAAFALFGSASDPATRELDNAAGGAIALLFVLTAVPAFVLASLRRAPRTALTLALVFPGVFAVLFVALTMWMM